jgi:lysophospholipase L1-like esterase
MPGNRARQWRVPVLLVVAIGLTSVPIGLFLVNHSRLEADRARHRAACLLARERLASPIPTGRPVFFGDSYVARGYGDLVGTRLGWPDPAAIALPGSGYVSTGVCNHMTMRALVPRVVKAAPDILIVAAGLNDEKAPTDTVQRQARRVLGSLRSGLPEARIVVLGPVTPTTTEASALAGVDRALAAASSASGVEFISALDWLEPEADFGADHRHPTPAGFRKLARHLAAVLKQPGR